MSLRLPYLVSGVGHVVVLALLLGLTTLQRPQLVVPPVHISLSGGGSRGGGAATHAEPEPQAAVTPPRPEVQPPPKAPEPPKKVEEKKVAKTPQAHEPEAALADGALPKRDPGIVGKSPPKQAAPPVPAQPAHAGAGTTPGSGGSGSGSGKGIGVEAEGDGGQAPWYWTALRDRIANAWRPPPSVGRTGEVRVKLHFVLSPSGGPPQAVEVTMSSKVSFFDMAAMRAVLEASPLPPLPSELGTEPFGVTLNFFQQY